MSWYGNLSRRQRLAGGALAVAGVIGVLASNSDAPPQPVAAEVATEVVTERVTEVVTEESMAAAEVASERARLNRVKGKLNDRKDELVALSHRLDRREREVEELEAAAVAAVDADPEPLIDAPEPEAEAAPVAEYYENCDAARAAGAAPVYRGDSGYGGHLDRDGDGVGCE